MIARLQAEELSATFGSFRVVDRVNFSIHEKGVYGLVGANGAGKTTLLNLISGFMAPSHGSIKLNGATLSGLSPWQVTQRGVARTFQDPRVFSRMTVLENTLLGFRDQTGESALPALFNRQLIHTQEANFATRANELLELVGLLTKREEIAGNLSWGDQKLLSLTRVLATGADVLLLDEPTAGTSSRELDNLIRAIITAVEQNKCIVIVEHNMTVLKEIANWIYFLLNGRIIVEGPPGEVLQNRLIKNSYLGV